MKWQITVHREAVAELNKLPQDMRAKLCRLTDLMEELGPFELREPHVKNLGNKLWEIRLTGRDGISRIIYIVMKDRRIHFLHAFIKKTNKTPKSAIECALTRIKEELEK